MLLRVKPVSEIRPWDLKIDQSMENGLWGSKKKTKQQSVGEMKEEGSLCCNVYSAYSIDSYKVFSNPQVFVNRATEEKLKPEVD